MISDQVSIISPQDCWMQSQCRKYPQCPQPMCIKLFKIDQLSKQALLSTKQREHVALRIDADGTDKEEFEYLKSIENNIEKFVTEGNNLYLFSANPGTGKTSWVLRLLNQYINKIWAKSDLTCRALFINVPRYLLAIKDAISNQNDYVDHIKKNALQADLVVFDEVGTKAVTSFEHENLLSIINARLDEGKSNFYTSNLMPQELQQVVGDRLYSRVVNSSINIELRGKDKRTLTVK